MNQSNKIIKYIAIGFGLFLAFVIVASILNGIMMIGNIFNNSNKDLNELIKNADITSLEIDIKATNVIIQQSDNFNIETNNENIKYVHKNKKLIITEKSKWISKNSDLVIYVPKNILFEDFKISSAAGMVDIENINAKNINLNLSAGKLDIKNIVIENSTKIESGAGEIVISNSQLNNLDLDIGAGKTTINSELLGKSEINCGVGELKISLKNESDYTINVNKGLGIFRINNKSITNGETYGTGPNEIEINGGIGNTRIDFKFTTEQNETKEFTKTYTLLNITKSQEENSYYLTLQQFQGEVDTVLVKNLKKTLEIGKIYEFKFEKINKIEDNINSIFQNSKLIDINETTKQGLDQTQDSI